MTLCAPRTGRWVQLQDVVKWAGMSANCDDICAHCAAAGGCSCSCALTCSQHMHLLRSTQIALSNNQTQFRASSPATLLLAD